jgi:hypothetical protein
MTFQLSFLTLLCWLMPQLFWAQPLAVLVKNAEKAAGAGRVLDAAEAWERAARLKKTEAKYFYSAAEGYAQARDYVRAADCYRLASEDTRFPLAKLRQARALKQQGRYAEASALIEDFAAKYKGDHKAVVMAVAENEWQGCAMALSANETVAAEAQWLGDSLNTAENEFAPISFSDNLLYFSRSAPQNAQLLRSMKTGAVWGFPKEAALPPAVSHSFRSGCFSPDGNRFYYASCEAGCPSGRGGSAEVGTCALFVLERGEGGWRQPQKLPDYVNWPGSNSAFPHVAEWEGKEYLYFSSDKAGGFGGLDLYVCERSADSGVFDFSFPQNLGMRINTGADEICPHYDADNAVLWFSSMGHPSYGGMDIFFSEKEENGWARPQNAGKPYNSPADDYFFYLKKNRRGAFFCSNRSIAGEKTSTLDDDLFQVE